MKLKVHSVSGPAHQLVDNGQPCDKWSVTIKLSGTVRANLNRYYLLRTYETREKALKELEQYLVGEVINVPDEEVMWVKGGKIVRFAQ